MKYEINYGRDFGGKIGDKWLWRTIEAETEDEARKILFENYKVDRNERELQNAINALYEDHHVFSVDYEELKSE